MVIKSRPPLKVGVPCKPSQTYAKTNNVEPPPISQHDDRISLISGIYLGVKCPDRGWECGVVS